MIKHKLAGICFAILWGTSALATTIFKDPFETPEPVALRVVITPGAKLLTQSGQTAQLTAQVLDQDDQPVDAQIIWRSKDESMVSVDDSGLITSRSPLGSAQIIAEAPDALPGLVLVTIANPADGAILITDADVIGPPTPVDPEASVDLGYEYTVILQNVAMPDIGEVVLGTGAIPIAGRVVSATQDADTLGLTLAVIAPEELFDELEISQKMDLTSAFIEVDSELSNTFAATRLSDGSLVLSPLEAENRAPVGTSIDQFLDCETSLTNWQNIFTINLSDSITLDPSLSFDLQYSTIDGLQRLVVNGGVSAAYEMTVRTQAAFEGKATCKFQVGRVLIPVGGPLSWIFSGQVPLGVGLEVGGKVSSTEPAGYDLTAVGNANFTVGVDCESECELLSELSVGADGTARLIEPPVEVFFSNFQLDLTGYLFSYADLSFGNPILEALQFTALGVKAGIKQSGSFRSIAAQVAASTYASDFKLELTGSAGAGNSLQALLQTFNIVLPSVDLFSISSLLAQSPKGSLSITPGTVAPGNAGGLGDQATFTVDLNPSTYLGVYNVEEVAIYWQKPDGQGGTSLELSRPGCNTFIPNNEQTQFSCQTDFLEEHTGTRQFYAFVKASAFGATVPFWLEIKPDSLTTLQVGEPARLALVRSIGAQQSLWTMNEDGTDLQQLSTEFPQIKEVRWSSDGLKLYFLGSLPEASTTGLPSGTKGGGQLLRTGLYSILADGQQQQRLISATEGEVGTYDVSVEGQWIAATVGDLQIQQWDIVTLRPDGSTLTTWTDNGTSEAPVFAPVGNDLVFDNDFDIGTFTVANPQSGGFTIIAGGPQYQADPWSPSGDRILLFRGDTPDEGQYELFTVRPDGTGLTNLSSIDNKEDRDAQAEWSPDGSKILFIRYNEDPQTPTRLMVVNAGGTGLRSVSDGLGDLRLFRGYWSADSRWVGMSLENESTGINTYLVRISDSTVRTLPANTCCLFAPQGSGFIYFDPVLSDLVLYDPDSASSINLTNTTGYDGFVGFSADGTKLAFSNGGSTYLVNLDGTGRVEIADFLARLIWQPTEN